MANEGKLSAPRLLVFIACIIFALGSLGTGIWLSIGDVAAGGIENTAHLQEHFTYTIADDEVTITGLASSQVGLPNLHLDIPQTINGYPVRHIGNAAFQTTAVVNHRNIVKVTLPDGLLTIGSSAFASWTMPSNGLTSLDIPESVTYIGSNAFANNQIADLYMPQSVWLSVCFCCSSRMFAGNNLTSISIPEGVFSIPHHMFDGNRLTTVQLPSTIHTIGDFAFANNNIETIVFPSSTRVIDSFAFAWNQLTSVALNDGLLRMRSGSFEGNNLTSLPNIPTSLQSEIPYLGSDRSYHFLWRAFAGNQFTELIIPDTLVGIDTEAFAQNTELTTVFIPASVLWMGGNVFARHNEPMRIYVEHATQPAGWSLAWDSLGGLGVDTRHTVIWDASVTRFNTRGGQPIPSEFSTSGGAITMPSAIRAGFEFIGWASSPEATTPTFIEGNIIAVTLSQTFYALWKANEYTLTFSNLYDATHANGENDSDSRPFTVEDLPLSLLAADRPGFNFLGWYDNPEFTGSPITTVTQSLWNGGNMTVFARWSDPIGSSISFTNLQSGDTNPNASTFVVGDLPLNLQLATRTGWTFHGWYTDSDFTDSITSIGMVGDITIYARFTINEFVLAFEDLYGTTPNNPTTFTVNSSTHSLANPSTRDGWSFGGWWTQKNGQGTRWTSVPVGTVGSQTLYAYWTLPTHSIIFKNLYSTPHQNQSTFNRETQTFTLQSPSARQGFNFEGWYTTSTFDEGTRVTVIVTGTSADVVLFARWAVIPGEEPCLYPNPCDCEVCTDESYTPSSWFRDNLNWILFALAAMFTVLALLILLAKRHRRQEESVDNPV